MISSTDAVTTGYQVNTHLYYDAQQRPITITLEDHDASLPTTTVTMATVNFGYNALGQRSAAPPPRRATPRCPTPRTYSTVMGSWPRPW